MTTTDPLIAVADALTAEIAAAEQAGRFAGLAFTPVRSYADWEAELKDFGTLHVDVVPFNYDESALSTRGSIGYVCSASIVVRQMFGPDDRTQCGDIEPAKVDRLVMLVRELHEMFVGGRMDALPEAVWQESKIIAAYDYDLLRTPGMFAGVARVSFKLPKALA